MRKFLLSTEPWVIIRLGTSDMKIETVPELWMANNSERLGWKVAGQGSFGWQNAISHLAQELAHQARAAAARETREAEAAGFHEVGQLDLWQPTLTQQEQREAKVAEALVHLGKQLE